VTTDPTVPTYGRPPACELVGVTVDRGGHAVLAGVDLAVAVGQVVALVAPPGGGKTTLLDVLGGTRGPDAGIARRDGRVVSGLRPDQLGELGIGRTLQGLGLFHGRTAEENVLAALLQGRGLRGKRRLPLWPGRRRKASGSREDLPGRARAALAEVGLDAAAAGRRVEQLDDPQRARVALARALVTDPTLLLLDGPGMGLAQSEAVAFLELVVRLRRDRTLVLADRDPRLVAGVADRIVVLDSGRVVVDGAPEQVRRDPALRRAYIGSRPAS
jgi:branched-chain amino acid transport system ATP-binding protein